MKIFALGLGLVVGSVARAEPPEIVRQEITHLLQYIQDSGCEFKRNGSWNSAKAAEAHVRDKYGYLLKLGRIGSTMDFIDMAATKSSLSGQPYEIKCGSDLPMPSSRWLTNELARYREMMR